MTFRSWVSKWFGPKRKRMPHRKNRLAKARLDVEALEVRFLPSGLQPGPTIFQPEVAPATPINTEAQVVRTGETLLQFADSAGPVALTHLTATITWGDGTSTTGITSASTAVAVIVDTGTTDGSGNELFQLNTLANQAQVYEEVPTSTNYTVTVTDDGFNGPVSVTGASTPVNSGNGVADPAITVNANSGALSSANEAAPTPSGTVIATFSDPGNPNGTFDTTQTSAATAEYTAVIDWGDGSTTLDSFDNPSAFVSTGSGNFNIVPDPHTYAEEGPFNINVTVTHDGQTAVGPVQTDSVTVSDQTILVRPMTGVDTSPINEATATDGHPGIFNDPGNPGQTFDLDQTSAAPEYIVTIDWGDGNSTTVDSFNNSADFMTSPTPGDFGMVVPGHTYAEEGVYTVSMSVQHDALAATGFTTTEIITVNDPNVTVNPNSGAALAAIDESGGSTPAGTVIGTFTDPGNPSGTFDSTQVSTATAEYTATIDWGDGSSTTLNSFDNPTAFAFTGGGNFSVVAPAHTYSSSSVEEGTTNITLTVTHNSNPAVGPVQTDSITVNDQTVTVNPGSGIDTTSINEATATDGLPGIFTDPGNPTNTFDTDQTSTSPEYTVTIDWSDGSSTTVDSFNNPAAFIPLGGGSYGMVVPGHTYAEEGVFTVSMSVQHDALAATGFTSTETITVNDPNVTVNPGSGGTSGAFTSTEAGDVGGTVLGTFTDPGNPSGTFDSTQVSTATAEYTATIDWGDGTSVADTTTINSFDNPTLFVFQGGGTFEVIAPSHVYAEEGTFNITLTLTHDGLAAVGPVGTATATVNDAAITVNAGSGTTLSAINEAGSTPGGEVIGTFTDPGNPNGTLGANDTSPEYTATIDWGDGVSTTVDSASGGIVYSGSGGVFNIIDPGHTYNEESVNNDGGPGNTGGIYNINITVTHQAQTVGLVTTDSITVNDQTVSVNPGSGDVLSAINEGQSTPGGSTVIGTFSDPGNPSGTLDGTGTEYSATIDWGDGTSSTVDSVSGGIVYDSINNVFDVLDPGHVYAEESTNNDGGPGNIGGVYQITVSVTHDSLPATAAVQTDSITVNDVAITVNANSGTGLSPINEGQSTPGAGTVLGTFTDPANPNGTLDTSGTEYSATIDWGDGTSSTVTSAPGGGIVYSGAGGVFNILDPGHTYAEESVNNDHGPGDVGGVFQISIAVTHDSLTPTSSVQTDSITVNDPALTANPASPDGNGGGYALTPVEGQSTGTVTVATFTDPGGAESTIDYSATIDWGDGNTSIGAIVDMGGGLFAVQGSNTYAEESAADHPGSFPSYAITTTITHESSGPAITATSSATVSDPAVIISPISNTVVASEGVSTGTVTVATFTDPGGPESTNDYSATIDWGDGNTSPADGNAVNIVQIGSTYSVEGVHTYAEEGAYAITVTVDHEGNSTSRSFPGPGIVFAGPYVMENWSSSGIAGGSTSITPPSGPTSSAQFSYNVNLGNPGGGVSFRTATFSTTAAQTGPLSFTYDYSGYHAFFRTNATFQVFADGPSGTTTDTIFSGPASGGFDFQGSHTINVTAGFTFGFIVGGSNFDSDSQLVGTLTIGGSGASISDPGVSVNPNSGAALPTINEQQSTPGGSTVIGTFSDPGNPSGTFDPSGTEYSATIDWGDGTSSTVDSATGGIVYDPINNVFDVLDPGHVYTEESTNNDGGPGNVGGVYQITVSVTHDSLPPTAPVQTDTITVNDQAITVNPASGGVSGSFTSSEATDIGGTVLGTFTDPGNPNGTLDASGTEYSVTIGWGDGTADTTIDSVNNPANFVFTGSGTFQVIAPSHINGEEGVDNITLNVTHDSLAATGPVQTATDTVTDPAVTVNAGSGAALASITEATGSTPANTVIGTFSDPGNPTGTFDPAGTEYSATIDWGDGTSSTVDSSTGGIVYSGAGVVFNVLAPAHTYAEESTNNDGGPGDSGGVYNITVSVTHDALPATAVVATDTITVTDPAVTINPQSNVNYPDFAAGPSLGQINLNGSATDQNSFPRPPANVLQLNDGFGPEAGTAWLYSGELSPTLAGDQSFSTRFQFLLHGGSAPPGDGITFTIQNDPNGAFAEGSTGTGLGYGGIGNSVAVGFETSGTLAVFTDGSLTPLASGASPFSLFGAPVNAWVDYDATTHNLSVFVSQTTTKPSTPALTTTVDLGATIASSSNLAFVGFTGGTDATSSAVQEIQNWKLTQPEIFGTEGTTVAGETVATFTDTGNLTTDGTANDSSTEYTAIINWGDGTETVHSGVSSGDGIYFVGNDPVTGGSIWAVVGSHAFSEEEGSPFAITVTVNHEGVITGPQQTAEATITDAALTNVAAGPGQTTTENTATVVTLATFQDPGNPSGNILAEDYTADVNWGDGTGLQTNVPITVTYNAGTFTVTATHTFVEESTTDHTGTGNPFYVVTTQLHHEDTADPAPVSVNVMVTDQQITGLTSANLPGSGQEGAPVAAIAGIAAFTDPAGTGDETAADFTATIDWGDGTTASPDTSPGTVVPLGGGNYSVNAPTHTYVEEGTYTVNVSVSHDGLSALSAPSQTIVIADQQILGLSLTSVPASGMENVDIGPVTGLAHFTDPAGAGIESATSDFTATIDWGDGQTSAGTIFSPGGGNYRIDTTGHVYIEEGSYIVSVTVRHGTLPPVTSNSQTIVVADQQITAPVMASLTPSGQEGAPLTISGSIASFTDPAGEGTETTADFSATIDWGDGMTSAGMVTSEGSGNYSVSAPAHSYSEENTYAVTVTVQHGALAPVTSSNSLAVTISDQQLTGLGSGNLPANGTEGLAINPFAGIATFTDPAGAGVEPLTDFTASIDWGDGTTSPGVVASLGGGNYRVDAPGHTYTEEGTYTVNVSITHDLLPVVPAPAQTITVGDPAVVITPQSFNAIPNLPFSGQVVATFTDPGGAELVSGNPDPNEYSATIDWGDGNTSTSAQTTITYSSGTFSVAGGHTYASQGVFTAKVTVIHGTAAPTTSNVKVTVAVAPGAPSQLVVATAPTQVTAGQLFSFQVDVEDSSGNIVTTDSSLVTVSTMAPGFASGSTTVQATAGVASFTSMSIQKAGAYTLTFTDGSLTPATTDVTVIPAAASKLAFVNAPTAAFADLPISPAFKVDVQDQFGNLVSTDTSQVTVVASSTSGFTTLPVSVNAVGGEATFSTFVIPALGTFTLHATDGSLSPADSTPFVVTFNDNFNETSGTLSSALWTVQRGGFTVSSEMATGTAGVNFATANNIVQSDVVVTANLTIGSNPGSNSGGGLVARSTGLGDGNMYVGALYPNAKGLQAHIQAHFNGKWYSLATGQYVTGTSGTLEFEVVGRSLKLFFNGKLVAYAYDSRLTSGTVGMRLNSVFSWANYTAAAVNVSSATVPFSDNFSNPSDGSQLSHYWTDQIGNFTIEGGAAVGTGSVNMSTVNGISQGSVTLQATMDATSTADGNSGGLVARYNGTGDANFYLAQLARKNNTLIPTIRLHHGGIWTTLATGTAISATTATVKFVLSGPSLQMFVGGNLVASANSTTLASGAVGIRANNGVSWSNFSVS
jgi:hypothetical protein